jgi:hypothetical protein
VVYDGKPGSKTNQAPIEVDPEEKIRALKREFGARDSR